MLLTRGWLPLDVTLFVLLSEEIDCDDSNGFEIGELPAARVVCGSGN